MAVQICPYMLIYHFFQNYKMWDVIQWLKLPFVLLKNIVPLFHLSLFHLFILSWRRYCFEFVFEQQQAQLGYDLGPGLLHMTTI